jgi:hypothetical protein
MAFAAEGGWRHAERQPAGSAVRCNGRLGSALERSDDIDYRLVEIRIRAVSRVADDRRPML